MFYLNFAKKTFTPIIIKVLQNEKAKPYIEVVANHEFMEDQQCAFEVNMLTTNAFKQIEKKYKAGKFDRYNEGE